MRKNIIFFFVILTLLILSILIFIYINTNGRIRDLVLGQFNFPSIDLSKNISQEKGKLDTYKVSATIDFSKPAAQTSDKFLSFSIDISQLVGGKWWNPDAKKAEGGSGTVGANLFDFSNPNIIELTKELTPAYLKVGGSESDKTYYNLKSDNYYEFDAPEGFESVLTKKRWDDLIEFSIQNKLDLIFTLNAGPGTRDQEKNWLSNNSEKLIKYSSEKNYKIKGWVLGNEINLFWYIHGLKEQIYPDQLFKDFTIARNLIKKYYPESFFMGQGSAFWPVLGEPLSIFFGITEEYTKKTSDLLDVLTWHYYPQQSRRGPIASRRAKPSRLLKPENLDEVKIWANKMISWKNESKPDLPIWMGETGNAQFGGEPGVSDKYIGGLWWLDQLGTLALLDHKVVIRQTLTGMNYGLLDDENYNPRPDYWNSYLWKKLMGNYVYKVGKKGKYSDKLRIYAHLTPTNKVGQYTILAINLDHRKRAILAIPELNENTLKIYSISTDDILGDKIFLNNKKLTVNNFNELFNSVNFTTLEKNEITINPLSYNFISVH